MAALPVRLLEGQTLGSWSSLATSLAEHASSGFLERPCVSRGRWTDSRRGYPALLSGLCVCVCVCVCVCGCVRARARTRAFGGQKRALSLQSYSCHRNYILGINQGTCGSRTSTINFYPSLRTPGFRDIKRTECIISWSMSKIILACQKNRKQWVVV